MLATSACGGIDPLLSVGTFVLPDDILDRTTNRAKTFFEGTGLGILRHAEPFCPALRGALAGALESAGVRHRVGGVYVCMDGPRLETPAEIRLFASQGASLVGMTLAPEFALARELELCYAPLSWVVNPAEGVAERPYRPDVLFEGMATAEELARWLADNNASAFGGQTATYDAWLDVCLGSLACSAVCDVTGMHSGVEAFHNMRTEKASQEAE